MSSASETEYKYAAALRAPPTSSTLAGTALQHVQRQQPQLQQQRQQQQRHATAATAKAKAAAAAIAAPAAAAAAGASASGGLQEHLALCMLLGKMTVATQAPWRSLKPFR